MERINVIRSSMPSYREFCEEIRELWDSRWLTNMGVKHQALQEALARYLQVKQIDLVTNGHMALELSLQAMELKGEVITTPFTFVSTTHAIVRSGLTPVFCDINPITFTLDPSKIESLITQHTCAIVPVHVYGNLCDVEAMKEISDHYGLKVLYDAAHAFGVKYKGQGAGSLGDVSCFSFHATKVFHTIEGGCICYQAPSFGESVRHLKNFGINGPESVGQIGSNAKMDEFRAAMGLCNLRHIEEEIEKRKQVVKLYREQLENIPGIQLNPIQKDVQSNYSYFPVVFDEKVFGTHRDYVQDRLQRHGIFARKYFYPLASSLSCYGGRYHTNKTPIAQQISENILTLPLYAGIEESTIANICHIIRKECRERSG